MPHTPSAEPSRFRGNTRERIAMVCGTSSEAPKPWAARATMRASMVGARPHTSEEAVKIAMPTW